MVCVRGPFPVVAVLFALLLVAENTRAELRVSKTTGMRVVIVGAAFPDDFVFELSDKSELRLLQLPHGTPFVMRGPYKGTLRDYVAKCTGSLARFRKYCRSDSGGDRLPIGGTRGER